jgi:hypothetical protein
MTPEFCIQIFIFGHWTMDIVQRAKLTRQLRSVRAGTAYVYYEIGSQCHASRWLL